MAAIKHVTLEFVELAHVDITHTYKKGGYNRQTGEPAGVGF